MTTSGRWTGSSREDELLSRLYQQVTGQQAARFAAGYDVAAGLDRYRAWLREHAAEDRAGLETIQARTVMAVQASAGGTGVVTAAPDPGEAVTADRTSRGPAGTRSEIAGAWDGGDGGDADRAVTALYRTHYRSLVRLAALLLRDVSAAEEVVQDSFVAMHGGWHRLRDSDKALSYLRQSVVNRSRSVLRHRIVVDRLASELAPDTPGGEQEDISQLERSGALISALRTLPARQREVLVLRYYGDLSEAQIAATMGISRGAVKSHTTRAMSSLRAELSGMDE
jgi:RNA polymerase sigma-70 factor (sigma-E family)